MIQSMQHSIANNRRFLIGYSIFGIIFHYLEFVSILRTDKNPKNANFVVVTFRARIKNDIKSYTWKNFQVYPEISRYRIVNDIKIL